MALSTRIQAACLLLLLLASLSSGAYLRQQVSTLTVVREPGPREAGVPQH